MHNALRINVTQWATIYPEAIPSCIGHLPSPLPAREAQLASLRFREARAQSQAMEGLLRQLLWGSLQAMGLFRDRNPIPVDPATGLPDIATGIQPRYDRWFARSLAILTDFFRQEGQAITVVDPTPLDLEACWRAWDAQRATWSPTTGQTTLIALVEACVRALPEILSGQRSATEVLFPDGSMHLVQGVYRGNAGADYFNGVLADVAVAYVRARLAHDPAAAIRILEIGAGTGGTTAALLSALAPCNDHIQEYCYTDLSWAFLEHAQQHYAPGHPYLTTRLFDVSQPIAGQGIAPDRYDVVIAANVLHATKHIRQTLRNAKAPLRKHGLILLNEITGTPLAVHLTFGLLEGWWLYDDPALRLPGNPGLAPQTWRRLLEEEGWRAVWFPAEVAHDLGQQVIVAESDGVVRQGWAPSTDVQRGDVDAVRAVPTPSEVASPTPRPTAPSVTDLVTETILQGLCRSLKISADGIDRRKPFSDYGLDSILGIGLVKHLNDHLGLDLNTAILFDHTSVERLTRYLVRTHGDRIRLAEAPAESVPQEQIPHTALSVGAGRAPQQAATAAGEGQEDTLPPNSPLPAPLFPQGQSLQRSIRGRLRRDTTDDRLGIAVIGMSGQFPAAENVDTFWENLLNGVDGVRELPQRYLNQDLYYHPSKQPHKTYCRWGGILAERACFDPLFFSISPREAVSMSPHQRLILQESWKALEDAGYNPKSLAEAEVGVFVGAEPSGYFHESFTGSSDAIVASRLSYYLDLKGPAMVINTGCSSSGVALHLACESLRRGESDLALAGGVFAALTHNMLIGLSAIDMLSPTGRCHTFDQAADGTAFSEGVGMVVLKRLDDAIADGDGIYGVIRGSGVNQDGASNGITAPSGSAQEALIVSVYEHFGIDPERISYVEAHGTGTRLGDPVEANALVRAFRCFTEKTHYCAVGSAKAHIGHTAASAGVIGVIKVLLSFKYHHLPGLLHFTALNPLIEFEGSPFYVDAQAQEWRSADGRPLMAAINSFGHSGTNAHLVVEEYLPPPREPHSRAHRPVLVPLSAQTAEALAAYAEKLAHFLRPAAGLAAHLQGQARPRRELTAVVADILAVAPEDIDPRLPLADYGLEWHHLVTLRQRLQEDWQVDADLHALGRCLSLAEMVEYLTSLRPPDSSEFFGPSPSGRGEGEGGRAESRGEASLTPTLSQRERGHKPSGLWSGEDISPLASFSAQEKAEEDGGRGAAAPGTETTPALDLEALAYTLQVGREAMKHRVAFLVRDAVELCQRLTAFAAGNEAGKGCWRGEVSQAGRAARPSAVDVDPERVAAWLRGGRLDKVAEAWLQGYEVDWRPLYGEDRPPRLHLPTYPFARERYDAAERPAAAAEARAVARLAAEGADGAEAGEVPMADETAELMTFEEVWQEQPQTPTNLRPQTLLCFLSDPEAQRALCDLARQEAPGARLLFVARDDAAGAHAPDVSTEAQVLRLDPLDKASYIQAFQCLRDEGAHADAVLYLWADEDATLARDPMPIVYILQAMAETKLGIGRILLAARSRADSLERCYLESWIGFERSLGLVRPDTPVAVVLDESDDRSVPAWLQRLWSELYTARPESVLYQRGQRHVCRVRPIPVAPIAEAVLRTGGTYLITGGCGGLGLWFARHLAASRAANLILTGRSPLEATKRAAIESLEAAGGRVLYIQADVCDAAAMAEAVRQAQRRFGALHGVIHAAGVQSVGNVFAKSIRDFQRVLDPKIAGTLALDQALRDELLDFICYFSSSAAVLGDFGSCDYAVASRFQGAYAARRNALVGRGEGHGRAVAVHWPLWQDGGMGFRDAVQAERLYLQSSGQRALRTPEGLEVFERLLAQGNSQPLVLVGQPDKIRRFLAPRFPLPPGEGQGEGGRSHEERLQPPSPQPSPEGREDLAPGPGRRADMKSLSVAECVVWDLAELTSRLLQIPRHRLDPEVNLADFGFDSIGLSEFAAVLRAHFAPVGLDTAITPALFFGHPSLGLLAQYFMAQHGQSMQAFYQEGSETPVAVQATPQVPSAPVTRIPKPAAAAAFTAASHDEPIAIIGMSGRFPQARNVTEMWAILAEGREAVTEIPADRFDWRLYYGDPAAGKTDGKWCGCVPGVREFDPLFFDISPREAETMDPRQRLLLQEAWNALEDAGYGRKQIEAQRIGVFVGAEQGDYQQLAGLAGGVTASHNAVLAARLAYFLNLHGPNMAIDTACSSGLVAAHQACLSLRAGECTTALAAGVHLLLTPSQLLGMSGAGMLSPDGHCRAFDRRANGLVPGEAVAVVVLKRLAQAEADGDTIHAVICGSGVNYDGKTNGITAPSGVAQAELLNAVYERCRIDPAEIEYVIAHGTGTRLGDPVEIQALEEAFNAHGGRRGNATCALTSVKTNFGHTFAASGLVSLIALVQAMRHRTIPASLNCEQDSDYVDWQASPFYVNKQARPWTKERRLSAVSAFGMSGTNAHMVVGSYDAPGDSAAVQAPFYLLALSARTPEALRRKVDDMVAFLQHGEAHDLAGISYTLLQGRWHFRQRCAIVVQDRDDAIQVWRQMAETPTVARPNLLCGEVSRGFTARPAMHELGLELLERCRIDAEQPDPERESYREDLLTLAELYCQGYELPWERLFPPGMRRVGLPTYPFARQHHWVAETVQQPLAGAAASAEPSTAAPTGTLMLQACWDERDIAPQTSPPANLRHLAVFCDLPRNEGVEAVIERRLPGTRLLFPHADEGDIIARFQSYAARLLAELQGLIAGGVDDRAATNLIQVVIPDRDEAWPLTGLTGLLQTARLEHPALLGQVIAVDPKTDAEALAETLVRERHAVPEGRVRYDAGRRFVAGWREMAAAVDAEAALSPWRDGATYLITGGAGGLGRLIARDILSRVKDVNLTLVGRSAPPEAALSTVAQEAEQAGARLIYRQVDVTDGEAVTALVRDIERQFGGLNGVIHAAGVVRDSAIRHKTAEELRAVLAPKVEGLVHLDRATRYLDLDFFVCFASMTGVLGNPGQADYAAANAFMDGYAAYRNGLVAVGRRRGRTLSIDWPMWRQGGMAAAGADAAWETVMRQRTGMTAMSTAAGLRALYRAMAAGQDQVLVAEGEVQVIRERLFPGTFTADEPPAPTAVAGLGRGQLRAHTARQLKQLLADYLKLDAGQIDAEEPLERYGIDSIMIRQLNERLAAVFGKLSATLFYEYQTLTALADYLAADHAAACARWTGAAPAAAALEVATRPEPEPEKPDHDARQPVREAECQAPMRPGRRAAPERQPVAIIGLSGRYPMAGDLEKFWDNLKAGRDCIAEIPEDRWPLEGFYQADKEEAVAQGKSYCKWGGFVERFAEFDCLFFNISPREALNMDPQERLFVEACWAVLEDAGYTRALLAERHGNRVGVFAGITKTGFDLYGPEMWRHGEKFSPHTSFSSVANRVSYLFNLCGPSLPIDTMCSSSLTAVHEACEHLRRGDCELAIAGGVNLYLHPTSYTGLCHQRMLSVDGRCKSFGKGGNGYVPGEGVGVVLLKPLDRAVADGDRIRAVIRATGINHDGKTNGYTVPNPNAQGALIRETLEKAGVSARAVSYIEAHGTGTDLGDPIEITGLNQAFRAWTQDIGFCAIGSVKSNIGHLEAAAGIAGLTKVVLQLQHEQLVPTLHADEVNPNIDFARSPFVPQRELAPWSRPQIDGDGETREYSRIAGVSSFGAGGANAHVILEEYREPVVQSDVRWAGDHAIREALSTVFVLSARKPEELRARARQLLQAIARRPLTDADLASITYTLQTGREAMEERLALTAASIAELAEKLREFLAGDDVEGLVCGQVDRAAAAEIAADQGVARRIEDWLRQGQIARLLGLWVKGLDVDWHRLYGEQPPRRLALPTYPFAGRRFWLPGRWDRGAPQAAIAAVESLQPVASETDTAGVTQVAPLQPAATPQSLMLALKPLAPVPYTPPGPEVAASEGDAKRAGEKVPRTPSVGAGATAEAITRPKPRGIVLQPLTAVPSSETHPEGPPAAVVMPESVAKQTPTGEEAGLPAPLEILRQELAASLAEALFLEREEVALDRPFIELGLDSIVAAEWVRALNTQYGINITVSRVYDHPTIIAFAAFLITVLPDRESMLPGEAPAGRLGLAAQAAASRTETGPVPASTASFPVEPPSGVSEASAPEPSPADDSLREALAASLAEALFLEREEVALDRPFIELGLDSIVAAEWVRALNAQYGTNITVTKVYDHPTILAFAAFLKSELRARTPATMAASPSLDDVLRQVQQGDLDIAQAYQLLRQIGA
jgi:acyl transferase domain-containing protein/aryl carrier-like protein/SAM-dependent methyltransferase